ncbi:MAG: copper amine oxidase N-terminal domain-containing protein [Clostridiales Family XIII bacterium]|jgi:hypothetical protein|nr:copper amine oxidase N-terminal domain-containing protein [Clostridiales Family XIII bacterium]
MMKKRILSIALALVMTLALVSTASAAEEAPGLEVLPVVTVELPEAPGMKITMTKIFNYYFYVQHENGSSDYTFFADVSDWETRGSIAFGDREPSQALGYYLFGFDGILYGGSEENLDLSKTVGVGFLSANADSLLGEGGITTEGDIATGAYRPISRLAADSAAPVLPEETPAVPQTAKPTASTVLVNGESVAFDAYNIAGNNYFKLRDFAYALDGTAKQFSVGWDGAANAISLAAGRPYEAVGGEMAGKGAGDQTAVPTTSKITLDGAEISLTAYNIDGNNYFKLRDIGQAFDFGVDWDGANNTIVIDTSKRYTPE